MAGVPRSPRKIDESNPVASWNSGLNLFRHLAQLEFLDLAGRGLGQIDEHDVARAFVAGKLLLAPGDDLVLGDGSAGPRLDERARRLAPFGFGLGDDGGCGDCRVLVKHVLDLVRGDILAARDDDILGAVLELDVAVWIEHAEIAGMEPATGERLLGRLLVLEI